MVCFLSYSHCGFCIWYVSFSLLFPGKLSGQFVARPNVQDFQACDLSWLYLNPSSFELSFVWFSLSIHLLFHLVCAHVSVFKSFVEKGTRGHPGAFSPLSYSWRSGVMWQNRPVVAILPDVVCMLCLPLLSCVVSPRVSSLPFPILSLCLTWEY